MLHIKVLGPGCPKCHETENVVNEAVAEAGLAVDVEKATDILRIAGYGVAITPAVVVDGEVKSVGKIPGKEDIKSWLEKTMKDLTLFRKCSNCNHRRILSTSLTPLSIGCPHITQPSPPGCFLAEPGVPCQYC